MGVSVALPAAMPRGGSRETTGEDPRDERGLTDGDLISRVARRDANAFEAKGFRCLNVANGTEHNHTAEERVSVWALERMLDVTFRLLERASEV